MVTNPKTVKDNLQVELGPDNQRKRVTNLFLLSLIRKQDNKTKTTRQVLPHAVEVNRPQQHMVNLSFQSNDKTTGSEQSEVPGEGADQGSPAAEHVQKHFLHDRSKASLPGGLPTQPAPLPGLRKSFASALQYDSTESQVM